MDGMTIFGLVGAVVSTIGVIASALTGMYYFGYQRAEKDWRRDDYFAPRPIATSVDKEIAEENIKLKQRCHVLSYELRERGVEIP